MKSFKLLFAFIFFSIYTFAQPQGNQVDVHKLMVTESVKHLRPKIVSNDSTEIIVFTVQPDVKPDSCFRIIETKGQAYLEVRFLDKNLQTEVLKIIYEEKAVKSEALKGMTVIEMHVREKFDVSQLPIKTNLYSIPISNSFKNKMLKVFTETIALNIEMMKLPSKYDIFDGTFYGFKINANGKTTETTVNDDSELNQMTEAGKHDFRYLVKIANLRIINDVRNGTFKETNYEIYK